MTNKMIRLALAAWLLLAAFGTAAVAQSTTQGAISGTVADSAGALVPGAAVTIHNEATNADQHLTTDASGYFKVPLLEPGSYTVTIAAPTFSTYVGRHVIVQVSVVTTVMPKLKPGASTETVEVSAAAPILNFESPDFASSLNTRALENVPVNNLRWSSLALTTPGVVSDSNGFGLVSIRGLSPALNNVLIDGADDNQAYYAEERGRTREAYSTPPESIREFQVETGVYAAEFGRAAGGVINSVTKSGGNQIHGQAYYSDRESKWGSYNDYTTNTTAVTTGGVTSFVTAPYKPLDSRQIWGGTAGGALIKDKLFWQYTFDQHHRLFPGTAKANNPAAFFNTAPAATLPAGAVCNLATGYLSGDTVAIDQQVCTYAARTGVSYSTAVTNYSNGLITLLSDLGTVPRFGDQEVNMPKLDWQINARNHVSFLYNRLRWDSPGGVQTQATNNYAVDTFGTDFVKLDYGVAKLTTLLSSSVSNELLYQYGRELNDEGQQTLSAFSQKYLQGTVGAGGPTNIPEVALATSTGFYLGSPYYSYRKSYPDERKWQIGDILYYSKGNHSYKFGVDMVHNWDYINNLYESNGYITYGYISNFLADIANEGKANDTCNSTALSAATSTTSAVGTYPCYSSFVQGFGGSPSFFITTFDYGAFAQDNWKVTPRLTLEYGLRYDYQQLPGSGANTALTKPTTLGTLNFTPYAGLTNAPSDKNNLGLRLGFSSDVFGNGKTVLRGGYGMFYGRISNSVLLNSLLNTGSPLGQYTSSLKPNAAGAPVFPNVIGTGNPPTPGSYFFGSHLQSPMVHQFDLILQQQIGRGTVVSFSYLGALSRELTNFVNTNLAPAETTATITISDTSGKGPIANGTQFVVPVYGTCTASATCPNPTGYLNTGFTNITGIFSNINASYNGAVVEVQNKSLRSLQFDVNYTWSHALDYNQSSATGTTTNNQYDPYGNQLANYGNSNYNVPSRVTGYVLYNFPNLEGRSWKTYLTNDWSLNTAFQAQSGLPYSLTLSGYPSSAAINSSWNGAGGTSWLPPIGRNTLKYPRDIVEDFRVQKAVKLTDRYSLEGRVDIYNVYNHQNVTGVSTLGYALSSFAGGATATYQSGLSGSGTVAPGTATNSNSSGFLYTPRQLQVGAKFIF